MYKMLLAFLTTLRCVNLSIISITMLTLPMGPLLTTINPAFELLPH